MGEGTTVRRPTFEFGGAWAWAFIVALVSITRFHELGVSLDPALYGSISRHLARHGNWWRLSASPTFFTEFHEHPYLALWLQAVIFKFLPANDVTVRLLGLITGCFTFYFLFRIAETLLDRVYANLLCLVTLFSVYFVGRIPTFYLDVPLVFFFFASFHFFLKSLVQKNFGYAAVSGLLFLGAFLTKGYAAFPMLGLLLFSGLWLKRGRFFLEPSFLVPLIALAGVIVWLNLQEHYGRFSFWSLYRARFEVEKGNVNRMIAAPISFFFFKNFFRTHALHLVLAIATILIPILRKDSWPAIKNIFVIGWAGSLLFLVAGSSIGLIHLHYFYPIYPIINLLTALFLYEFVPWLRKPNLVRFAFGFVLAYQIIWHVLPIPMRRKPDIDYFQLKAPIEALKAQGLEQLPAMGFKESEWDFREVGLWYWDIDIVLVAAVPEKQAFLVRKERGLEVSPNLFRCADSPKFTLYVPTAAQKTLCESVGFDRRYLR